MGSSRRTEKRFMASVSIPARYVVGGAEGEGRILDLSRGGLFLRSPMLPKEGEQIVISFGTSEGREIEVRGTVQWNTVQLAPGQSVPSGFGVRLSRWGTDYSSFLSKLVRADEGEGIPGSGDGDSVELARSGPDGGLAGAAGAVLGQLSRRSAETPLGGVVVLPAIYFVDGAQGDGLVWNLSRDALFLRGSLLPKEGEHLVIKFKTPNGREITVEGATRWVTHADTEGTPLGFGVELSSYGNDYLVVVEDFLSMQDPSNTGNGRER